MYGNIFYKTRRNRARKAARIVLPAILDIFTPESIIDVGCGTGIWLSEAHTHGVPRTLGIDGPWVAEKLLEIPPESFKSSDLTQPIAIDETFDLAISLEVAEHLHSEHAPTLIASLCSLAPVVIFSAAIPGQGGEHHVNEQWPAYWIPLFSRHGYRLCDILRPALWSDDRIPYWYRQNMLVFVSENAPEPVRNRLREHAQTANFHGADLVHPAHSTRALQYPHLTALIRALPYAFIRTLSATIQRLKPTPT